jgi:zinc transport system ATP-binding protein
MTANLVTIRDLCVELGGRPILRGVNADLERGEVNALVGLNGSGKSTLLRALVKEIPYAGTIAFNCGHDHRQPAPEHVGYVPQKLRIDAYLPLTVLDLFAVSLQRWRPMFLGVGGNVRRRVAELLARVGMSGRENSLVDKLSGGELQRVLLALALAPAPELLLLDEPAAGIDFKEDEHFYELIGELNKKTHVTVLLVSHDLSVVSKLADQVLCLAEGRIQCRGSPHQVLTGEMLDQTFGHGKLVYEHLHGHPPSDGKARSESNTGFVDFGAGI